MTETKKIDLRRQLKHLYKPPSRQVVEVEVPEMNFLQVDGEGDPNTSEAFREAVEALYTVSYALKFMVRKEEGLDYGVMPLEGQWWTEDGLTDPRQIQGVRDAWKWNLLIMQPEWVTEERFEQALDGARRKKKDLASLSGVRFETFREGRAAQIMHVGPFAEEARAVEQIRHFIKERGGKGRGHHHEIYLKDFRRTAPERLQTVIRHPFE